MYCLAQITNNAVANDANTRIYDRIRAEVERVSGMSLAGYDIGTSAHQIDDLIGRWLYGFYGDNIDTVLTLIDVVAALSIRAQCYQHANRIVVYNIVCDDGNLCVPMERLE